MSPAATVDADANCEDGARAEQRQRGCTCACLLTQTSAHKDEWMKESQLQHSLCSCRVETDYFGAAFTAPSFMSAAKRTWASAWRPTASSLWK